MSGYYEKMAQCAKISIRSREIVQIFTPGGFSSFFKKVDCASTLSEIGQLQSKVRELISDFDSATSHSSDSGAFIASIQNYLKGLSMSFIRLSMICKSLDKKQRGEPNNYQEDLQLYMVHLRVFNEMAEETAELFRKFSNELRSNKFIT